MHMTHHDVPCTSAPRLLMLPTEQTVIGLWRRACQQPGTRVEQSGLTCLLVPLRARIAANGTAVHANSSPVAGVSLTPLDSKRGLLQHLQQVCSLEFLRQQGLNSSLAVLLRKTNLRKLQAVHQEWYHLRETQGERAETAESESSSSLRSSSVSSSMPLLGPVLKQVLKPDDPGSTVLAVTLHESGVEFPYWIPAQQQQNTTARTTTTGGHVTVCLFLGTVRDMTRQEHALLADTCRNRSVFLVRLRLGRVT